MTFTLSQEEIDAHNGAILREFIKREMPKALAQLTTAKNKHDEKNAEYYRGRYRILLEISDTIYQDLTPDDH